MELTLEQLFNRADEIMSNPIYDEGEHFSQDKFNQFCQTEFKRGTRIYMHQLRNCWDMDNDAFDAAVAQAELAGAIVTMRLDGSALRDARKAHGDSLYFADNRGIFYIA